MTTHSDTDIGTLTQRPFGVRDKIGYMFGDFGNDFSFLVVSGYLLVFYTNVFGLNPGQVGLMFVVIRLLDAFIDVGWGHLVDIMKPSRDGRFRPWIRRMAMPVAIFSAALYMYMLQDWSYPAKFAYAAISYFVWSVVYTGINIPYGSMASVISADPHERSQLSVFRSFGATLAGIFVALVPPLFIYAKVNGQSQVVPQNFLIVGITFAAFSVVFYFLCYHLVAERVTAAAGHQSQPLRKILASLVRNRALIGLMCANLTLLLSVLLTASMVPYLWLNYFNNGALSGVAGLANYIPALVLVPVAAGLGRRFGKKEVATIGTLFSSVMLIAIYFAHITDPWVFIALSVVAGFGVGLFNMLVWAFITDVIDHEEVRSGRRDDGTVYAINTWARKVGQAVAGGLGGWALASIGFQAGQATQTSGTVQGIYAFSTLGPGILYLAVALFLLVLYPLTKSRVDADVAELARRRESVDA